MSIDGVRLRPGQREDYPFAEAIYIDAIRPLLTDLGCWNEDQRRCALRRSYRSEDVTIISLNGEDIGWMQVSERDTDFNLAQLQLLDRFCGRGIGARLIEELLARARQAGKTVSLSVVRTNRAIGLYRRLGFKTIDPDATPILDMVWQPGA